MSKQRPKRPAHRQQRVYFIKRISLVDDTQYFNHEGHRVYFEKAGWAAWYVGSPDNTNFTPEQEATITAGPIGVDDVPVQKWLADVLPETVTADEYLAAIDETLADLAADRDVSQITAKSFLRIMRKRH